MKHLLCITAALTLGGCPIGPTAVGASDAQPAIDGGDAQPSIDGGSPIVEFGQRCGGNSHNPPECAPGLVCANVTSPEVGGTCDYDGDGSYDGSGGDGSYDGSGGVGQPCGANFPWCPQGLVCWGQLNSGTSGTCQYADY